MDLLRNICKPLAALLLFAAACLADTTNLMLNDTSFEADYGPWSRQGEIVSCNAPDGAHALKVDASIMTHDRYNLRHSTPYVFSIYLKAQEPDTRVLVQAYRTNWDGRFYQTEVNVPQKWTRYSVAIPPQKEHDHNQFWMRVMPHGKKPVLMDASQLEEGAAATEYRAAESIVFFTKINSTAKGNSFLHGEAKSLTATYYNTEKTPTIFEAFLAVTDYYGNTILQGRRKMQAMPKTTIALKFPLDKATKLGFYQVDYAVAVDGRKLRKNASFCVLPPPRKVLPGHRKLFGICGGSGDMADDMARMGVQATAIAFRWAYENPDGSLSQDFLRQTDADVDELNKRDVDVALYLRRTPPWAAVKPHPHDVYPPKPQFIPEYEKFAFRVASHFKGRVSTYQMWGGEMDGLCDKVATDLGMSRDDFIRTCVELAKAGYKGVKRADPSAVVQTGAVCGVDCAHGIFPFQSQIVKGARGFFDEVVIHPYCYPQTFGGGKYVESPEEADLAGKYRAIAQMARTPVCNGEYGFVNALDEPYGSAENRRLAAYMARSFIITAAEPNVRTLLWYTFANSEGYSLWHWPDPRPAVPAYAAVSALLTNATDAVELPMGQLVKAYAFKAEHGAVAALWTPGNSMLDFDVSQVQDVHFMDVMGNPLSGDTITLSGAPVYVTCTGTRRELEKALALGKLQLAPVSIDLRLESLTTVVAYVSNLTGKKLEVGISFSLPTVSGPCDLAAKIPRLLPNMQEKLLIDTPLDIDWTELWNRKIPVIAKTNEGTVHGTAELDAMPCAFAPHGISVDGNLEDWDGLPMLELKTTEKLFPPDAASHGNWKGPDDLSVKAGVAWDKENFYFVAVVQDDIHVGAPDARQLCSGDCVQIAFDTLNNAFKPGYMDDDLEYNFAFSEKAKGTITNQSWPRPTRPDLKFPVVAMRGNGCTIYEAAIPQSALGGLLLKHGSVFGFNFVAVDNDFRSNDYWMGLTYGICAGKNPSVFKKFVLVGD